MLKHLVSLGERGRQHPHAHIEQIHILAIWLFYIALYNVNSLFDIEIWPNLVQNVDIIMILIVYLFIQAFILCTQLSI